MIYLRKAEQFISQNFQNIHFGYIHFRVNAPHVREKDYLTVYPILVELIYLLFIHRADFFFSNFCSFFQPDLNLSMTITPELQSKFNSYFARIMKQTPPELQSKWNGKIEWTDSKSYPHISPEVIQELPAGAKAAYVTLLNKLSRGVI